MLHEVFRTRQRKIIAAVLSIMIIIAGIMITLRLSGDKRFLEQAVMAENYLKAGNYEQAVRAYGKAMAMNSSDRQLLTMGLADAYVGMKEYDKALEVLRSLYKNNSGFLIKEKIEEVTARKTDFEYLQIISKADELFINKEYDKSIDEYEKAKLIKSKEVTSYRRIAEAYINMGEYELAKQEVVKGQELTQDDSLKKTLEVVDSYLMKEQYDMLVDQASEYIYQENYEDGIKKYKEAISLLPQQSAAYIALGQLYMNQGEYTGAVLLLQTPAETIEDSELQELYKQAVDLKEEEDEKNRMLTQLYKALENRDFHTVLQIMDLPYFQENIIRKAPVIYRYGEGDIPKGFSLIIYGYGQVYYGSYSNGMRKGKGIYLDLTRNSGEKVFYSYEGKWSKDTPNGEGIVEEEKILLDNNSAVSYKTVTEGSYKDALEHGSMVKYFYENEIETGRVEYTSQDGKPLPMEQEEAQPTLLPESGSYRIGELYLNDSPTGDYYKVDTNTVWGVTPFIKMK